MNRFFLYIFIMFVSASSCFADGLTGSYVESKIKERAEILNDCVGILSQKDRSADVKKHYLDHALSLFVNNGEPMSCDSIRLDGGTISTKSAYRNKPVKRKIKDYLQGVMEMRYSPIDMTAIILPSLPSQINVSDFVKCGDNLYRYDALITREFAGYIDGVPVYKDITPYTYSIYFAEKDTIDGKTYMVYLHDIEVEEKDDKKKK